jgi:hypothetical protein
MLVVPWRPWTLVGMLSKRTASYSDIRKLFFLTFCDWPALNKAAQVQKSVQGVYPDVAFCADRWTTE